VTLDEFDNILRRITLGDLWFTMALVGVMCLLFLWDISSKLGRIERCIKDLDSTLGSIGSTVEQVQAAVENTAYGSNDNDTDFDV
jgi:hypothetical protein